MLSILVLRLSKDQRGQITTLYILKFLEIEKVSDVN